MRQKSIAVAFGAVALFSISRVEPPVSAIIKVILFFAVTGLVYLIIKPKESNK